MRIRTIKPEFWASESNGRLSRDARLVFIGLFNLADNGGRLRGNPSFLAAQLFPFDDDGRAVVDLALAELEKEGKIERYTVGGSSYVWVTKFEDHQKTDPRYPSQLPAPGSRTPIAAECTPVAAESTPLDQGRGMEGDQGSGTAAGAGAGERVAGAADATALASAWNADTSPPLPRVTLPLSKVRDRAAAEALKRRPLPTWRQVFQRINASAFCRGSSDSKWLADFDWAIRAEGKKPEPAMKVLEGAYDRTTGPPAHRRDDTTKPRPEGRVKF